MRSLTELTKTNEPAWPLLQQWIAAATQDVQVLPAQRADGERALEQLQVTLRSPMGAVAYHTGGLLIDGGWLRILGAGCTALPRSLPAWNAGRNGDGQGVPVLCLVADDAVGGLFAINGGALPAERGDVCYFAPDSLGWESLACGYGDFLRWALQGDLAQFYRHARWPGWREAVAALGGSEAYSIYPPLWAAGPPIEQRSRRAVPIEELFALQMDLAAQRGETAP